MNIENIIKDYEYGSNLEMVATKYHIGKIKLKQILSSNNIKIRQKGGQKQETNYIVSDWKIEKYPHEEGYHYVAIYKTDGMEFKDHMNQGGFLTSYIKKMENIDIPTLYDRRKYYMETGNYWWEQWFTIEKREDKATKKCPYCDWETTDITNKSGAFEVHLREVHGIDKITYIKEHPEEKDYFALVCDTLNRQMSDNEDEYVVCQVCGKKLARIDWRHLKKHGMTQKQYINKYGNETVCKKLHDRLSHITTLNNMNMEPVKHSKPELEIRDFIKGLGFECKSNRKILNGKEIDIYIPELFVGVEYNGNKYHTEWFGGKSRQYHLQKTKLCKEKGVKLIHVFEDEFHNSKEIVFNKIAHILGAQQDLPKIYGRKCEIKEINRETADSFLSTYHIQGFDPSTVHYGAFYEDKLIAVMSFLRNKKDSMDWELTRFASDYNYTCCGVGGKLFKHFIKEHNPSSIKSFADRRWTVDEENNLYCQLGFKYDGYIPPDYKYYNPEVDKYKRFHKFGFRKKTLLKKYPDLLTPEMTETEMVKVLGYDRIWDCGLIKYIWTRKS